MDISKRAAFVKAAGKTRQKFSKGGMIKKIANRKYFATGDLVGPSDSGTSQNAANPNTGVLGTVGGALGLNNNYQATSASIQQGTNTGQLNDAYSGVQSGLNQQQGITYTLAPQASHAVANQNELANQYMAMSHGQGPNPAQNQLAQATSQNVANQNALMAGQRGAAGNVGLMARQAAQQGAQTQQQAVGQAATLGSQQQIAAQQNLANLSANQINQAGTGVQALNTAQQNEQSILQNANTASNNANVGMQSNINNTNAQTAAGNQGMMGSVLGAVGSGISAVTGLFHAHGGMIKEHHVQLAEMNAAALAHGKQNFAGGGEAGWGGQYVAPTLNPQGPQIEATPHFTSNANSIESGQKAAGALIGALTKPKDKGPTQDEKDQATQDWMTDPYTGASNVPLGSEGDAPASGSFEPGMDGGDTNAIPMAHGGSLGDHFHNYFSEGGKVPAMVSPGEIYLSPEKVHEVIHEGKDPAKVGHKFHGKARVRGDSLKNDIIPATLQDGGVVIDRKNMGSREKRELFVHKTVAKAKAKR